MIEVKRIDHEAINGRYGYFPAWYEVKYFYTPTFRNKVEIAKYSSKDDVLRVRSEYIAHGRRSSYDNALHGNFTDAYRYLFDMLNVDETSSIGEYMYA